MPNSNSKISLLNYLLILCILFSSNQTYAIPPMNACDVSTTRLIMEKLGTRNRDSIRELLRLAKANNVEEFFRNFLISLPTMQYLQPNPSLFKRPFISLIEMFATRYRHKNVEDRQQLMLEVMKKILTTELNEFVQIGSKTNPTEVERIAYELLIEQNDGFFRHQVGLNNRLLRITSSLFNPTILESIFNWTDPALGLTTRQQVWEKTLSSSPRTTAQRLKDLAAKRGVEGMEKQIIEEEIAAVQAKITELTQVKKQTWRPIKKLYITYKMRSLQNYEKFLREEAVSIMTRIRQATVVTVFKGIEYGAYAGVITLLWIKAYHGLHAYFEWEYNPNLANPIPKTVDIRGLDVERVPFPELTPEQKAEQDANLQRLLDSLKND